MIHLNFILSHLADYINSFPWLIFEKWYHIIKKQVILLFITCLLLFLEQSRGIEPPPEAWQASVLPLNHDCSTSKNNNIKKRVKCQFEISLFLHFLLWLMVK